MSGLTWVNILFNNFLQVLNEKILEKPKDKVNAYEMLKRWPMIFLCIFVSIKEYLTFKPELLKLARAVHSYWKFYYN